MSELFSSTPQKQGRQQQATAAATTISSCSCSDCFLPTMKSICTFVAKVEPMKCQSCEDKVMSLLFKIHGVQVVYVDLDKKLVYVHGTASLLTVLQTLRAEHYTIGHAMPLHPLALKITKGMKCESCANKIRNNVLLGLGGNSGGNVAGGVQEVVIDVGSKFAFFFTTTTDAHQRVIDKLREIGFEVNQVGTVAGKTGGGGGGGKSTTTTTTSTSTNQALLSRPPPPPAPYQRHSMGTATTTEVSLSVQGMTCGSCVARVEKRLRSLPGVLHVRVDLEAAMALVTYYDSSTTTTNTTTTTTNAESIRVAVEAMGYESAIIEQRQQQQQQQRHGEDESMPLLPPPSTTSSSSGGKATAKTTTTTTTTSTCPCNIL